jgi:hypothetical protein
MKIGRLLLPKGRDLAGLSVARGDEMFSYPQFIKTLGHFLYTA